MSQPVPAPLTSASIRSGIPAVDRYLDAGYATVPGMSSRFAAADLLRPAAHPERAWASPARSWRWARSRAVSSSRWRHALAHGETALGIDLFDWPNPEVIDRFEANCLKHGVAADRRITWKADSRTMQPEELLAKLGGRRPRFIHIDGEHSRAALTKDLELATAVLAPAGVIVLDDMLHPGYPTLMVAVHEYLGRHPEMCVLASSTARPWSPPPSSCCAAPTGSSATRNGCSRPTRTTCGRMGADFEPHWCLVLSLDTRLADIV